MPIKIQIPQKDTKPSAMAIGILRSSRITKTAMLKRPIVSKLDRETRAKTKSKALGISSISSSRITRATKRPFALTLIIRYWR